MRVMNDEPTSDQPQVTPPEPTPGDPTPDPTATPETSPPLGDTEPTPALAEFPVAPDAVIDLALPSTPTDFKATHELVLSDGSLEPVSLEGNAFRTQDGILLSRGEADQRGNLRRILPR